MLDYNSRSDNGIHQYETEFVFGDIKSWYDVIRFGISYGNIDLLCEIMVCRKDETKVLWLKLFEINYGFKFYEWMSYYIGEEITEDELAVRLWYDYFDNKFLGNWDMVLYDWLQSLKTDIVEVCDKWNYKSKLRSSIMFHDIERYKEVEKWFQKNT